MRQKGGVLPSRFATSPSTSPTVAMGDDLPAIPGSPVVDASWVFAVRVSGQAIQ